MGALNGKVAIVTGASSGIGRATAKLFAQQGAKVVLTARRKSLIDALAAEIVFAGGQAVAVAGDIREERLAKTLVETAVEHFGGLDVAVNNAGIVGEMKQVPDLTLDDWRVVIETNLTSGFFGAKYQIPKMAERGAGSVIFVSSFVGYTAGLPGMGAYAASKAGLIGLTKVLAVECGPKKIRVNAILPGGTDTAMNTTRAPDAPPGAQAFIEGLHALKRIASPDEIAQSAL